MKLTILVIAVACLMGAMLALTVGPKTQPDGGPEFVREEPLVPAD
jgi:hypothetical protein